MIGDQDLLVGIQRTAARRVDHSLRIGGDEVCPGAPRRMVPNLTKPAEAGRAEPAGELEPLGLLGNGGAGEFLMPLVLGGIAEGLDAGRVGFHRSSSPDNPVQRGQDPAEVRVVEFHQTPHDVPRRERAPENLECGGPGDLRPVVITRSRFRILDLLWHVNRLFLKWDGG